MQSPRATLALGSRLTAPLREFGLSAGLLYLLDRALRRLSRHVGLQVYEFMVQPVPEGPLRGASLAKDIEVREIPLDADEIAAMPVPVEMMSRRKRQGCVCVGAFRRGELIGYMWFSPGRYEEDEVRCVYEVSPPGRAVFDFDFFLFPRHRMGAGFVGLWNGANAVLRSRGVRYTFSRLTRFNSASRRAHSHLGWKRVGGAVFLTAWKFQLMASTVAPYLHACTVDSSGPTLRLGPGVLDATPSTTSPD